MRALADNALGAERGQVDTGNAGVGRLRHAYDVERANALAARLNVQKSVWIRARLFHDFLR